MKSRTQQIRSLAIGSLLLVALIPAMAAGVDINVNIPGVNPPPVYVNPQPVYVRPAPVYVQQSPVYVRGEPSYREGDKRYWKCKNDKCKLKKAKHHKHHDHDRDD